MALSANTLVSFLANRDEEQQRRLENHPVQLLSIRPSGRELHES